MGFSIFYSWQSDAPSNTNRKFIREALDEAISEIAKDTEVVNAQRVASGMEGIPGMPEVATVMFEQIGRSDLFLGDVSLVGKIESLKQGRDEKRTPNPNVMAELGYAAARMGWRRIICVMNEHYGGRDELPFDIRSKRHPIDYKLSPNSSSRRKAVRAELAKWIGKAIATCIEAEHQGVKEAISKLDVLSLHVCSVYQKSPYFRDLGQDELSREALKQVIDVPSFRFAVLRMLDLGLLETDAHSQKYAYHWSHRGKLVLVELAKRNQLGHVPEPVPPQIDDVTLEIPQQPNPPESVT